MKQYQVINGSKAPNDAEKVTLSEKDIQLGHFGGAIVALLDADVAETNRLLNQATGGEIVNAYPGNPNAKGTFEIGANFFVMDGQDRYYNLMSDVDLNPNEFTVFFVGELAEKVSTANYGILTSTDNLPESSLDSDVAPGFVINRHGLSAGFEKRGGLLQATPSSLLRVDFSSSIIGRKTLLTLGFSSADGIKIYENGNLIGQKSGATHPISHFTEKGQWQFLRNMAGKVYLYFVVNKDLTKDEDSLQSIHNYLLSKFDV